MRVRFAPSPTGNLHIGSLRTALFNWLLAKRHGGTYIVRIEDTDGDRSTPEFEANIMAGMAWMGLGYDEGPDAPGACGPYRQSERAYHAVIQQLVDTGYAYRCFCTEAELDAEKAAADAAKQPYRYSRKCRWLSDAEIQARLAANQPYTIRFAVPESGTVTFEDAIRGSITFDLALLSDFILAKSDGTPSYHVAVVSDDISMGITHILRGEDHISNTPKHMLLFQALLPADQAMPVFGHFPIILGSDRSKLSKRHGATAITDYQAQGFLPAAILNYLALLGWSAPDGEEIQPVSAIIQQFSLDRIHKAGAIFDTQKLTWMNKQYIKQLSLGEFQAAVHPFIEPAVLAAIAEQVPDARMPLVFESVRDSVERLDQINTVLAVYARTDAQRLEQVQAIAWTKEQIAILMAVHEGLALVPAVSDKAAIKAALMGVGKALNQPTGLVFKTVRLAVSGEASGPDLTAFLSVYPVSVLQDRCRVVTHRS
ncbi:MAG: glutamate--tRNA ligase [Planctomycetes bacterium]|nr:glutamate--tRNA ligase [Planctomycetota bacterium]